jgi:hypothetical protein
VIARDKLLHAAGGLAIALSVVLLTGDAALGFILALFVGIGKEVVDFLRGAGHTADPFDVLATAAPGLVIWIFTVLPSA